MARANESDLGKLHSKVAQGLSSALDNQSTALDLYEQFKDEVPVEVKDFLKRISIPNPALLTAAAKFLKDNDITVAPDDSDELSDLEKRLKEKRTRKQVNGINFTD